MLNLGIPAGEYPEISGSESGKVIVAGGAKCVWDDLKKVSGRFKVICVNDIGMHFPGEVQHLYSNNDQYLPLWKAARRDQYVRDFGPIGKTHSNITGGQITWPWPGSGTSALGAVYTALALGFEEVVLCGIPLDNSPHYFEGEFTLSNFEREVPYKGNGTLKYWYDANQRVFEGRVKAVSGRLKDVLSGVL